ncbi:MAG: long-chain fatty acid--CoA ligase, partial [Acidobacteriota bacterium]
MPGRWSASGPGGALRRERHFDGRELLCFSERWPHLNAMLDDVVRRHGEREAVVGDGRRLGYIELDRLAASAAGNLA